MQNKLTEEQFDELFKEFVRLQTCKPSCIQCDTTECVVREDSSGDDYCIPCLREVMRGDEQGLIEATDPGLVETIW